MARRPALALLPRPAQAPAPSPPAPRPHPGTDAAWARAFELWLNAKSPNTRRAYRRAWDDLLAYTGKHPRDILSADLQDWADHLARRTTRVGSPTRPTNTLSPSTINQWLSAVSSFYHFVTARYLIPAPDGTERPLHDRNPALTLARPEAGRYARADYLDAEDLARLLRAIPRTTVTGRRDYALLLGYILTGRRNAEWRTLKWGDLRARGPHIYYTWAGKNTDHARNELPPPVWEAILDHLHHAGRLETIQPDHYIFTPLTDSVTRLPSFRGAPWDPNRPLSAGAANRILRKHARRAGLDPTHLHIHTLRHSAAMLEDTLGSRLTDISAFLGHADPRTTMRYLDHLRGQPDTTWKRKADLLGLDPSSSPLPPGEGPAVRAKAAKDQTPRKRKKRYTFNFEP